MSNTNEIKEKRFMEHYLKLKAAERLMEDTIKMFKTLNSEANCTKVIEDFLSAAFKYDVNAEDLNEVKQILHKFISNELSQNETLAYLNYIYDVTLFKAQQLWFIQDIFKCYFL